MNQDKQLLLSSITSKQETLPIILFLHARQKPYITYQLHPRRTHLPTPHHTSPRSMKRLASSPPPPPLPASILFQLSSKLGSVLCRDVQHTSATPVAAARYQSGASKGDERHEEKKARSCTREGKVRYYCLIQVSTREGRVNVRVIRQVWMRLGFFWTVWIRGYAR